MSRRRGSPCAQPRRRAPGAAPSATHQRRPPSRPSRAWPSASAPCAPSPRGSRRRRPTDRAPADRRRAAGRGPTARAGAPRSRRRRAGPRANRSRPAPRRRARAPGAGPRRDRLQHRERARGVAGGEPPAGLRQLGADGLHARLLLRARGLFGRERAPRLPLKGARVAIVDEEDLRRGQFPDGLRVRVSLEGVRSARVVRGAYPHQAAEHHGDRAEHEGRAQDDPATPHRGVVIAPALRRVPPAGREFLQLERGGSRTRSRGGRWSRGRSRRAL